MNDRYDGSYGRQYDQGGDQYELMGYDEFGQPVYRQVPPQAPQPPRPPQQSRPPQQQGPGPGGPPGQGYGSYGGQYGTDQPYDGGPGRGRPYDGGQNYGGDQSYDTGTQRPVPPYEDNFGAGTQDYGYGYDPYGQAADTGSRPPAPPYDPYGTGQQPVVPPYPSPQDPYGRPGDTGELPRQQAGPGRRAAEQTAYIPQQQPRHPQHPPPGPGPAGDPEAGPHSGSGPPPGPGGPRDYHTEQFAFVEDPDEESEDVIDWLKFTESRTERREEARRRGRNRVVALVVVLALALVGGVGYLWKTDRLPGVATGSDTKDAAAAGPQNRDVIAVHLHNTKKGGTSTALLVNNTTTKQATTVLLPDSLALTDDDGTATTLGKSVDDDGSAGTRESLSTLLGTGIEGTWRLDTPYLNNLVELVGNIDVTTDADVPDPDKKSAKKGDEPLVKKGENQTLSGPMAVAYATYRASGESETAQLNRFGQVMQGVLRKMSSDPHAATVTVQSLAQILDPSLGEKDLGAFLAKIADRAKEGDYKTALLPVQQNGRLTAAATDSVVKDVLGGAVKAPPKDAAVRVGVQNASGAKAATEAARVDVVNGGYTFIDGGNGSTQAASRVTYADAAKKDDAVQIAKTLGLPDSAVRKGKVAANADVSVVLGGDYDYKPDKSG